MRSAKKDQENDTEKKAKRQHMHECQKNTREC